jgi:hypothetical protein
MTTAEQQIQDALIAAMLKVAAETQLIMAEREASYAEAMKPLPAPQMPTLPTQPERYAIPTPPELKTPEK